MGTEKTEQDIKNEDVAYKLNGLLLKAPFRSHVWAEKRGEFTVTVSFLKLREVKAILKLLEDRHKEWHG